ncbi:MAG TPA: hypothetical protein VFS40_15190, partial [Gemmatimonadales bacterium]|nr:hypothetical protein [Gemmatimonadales bacterium]
MHATRRTTMGAALTTALAATLALAGPLAAQGPTKTPAAATTWRPVAASGIEIDSTRPRPYRLLAPGEYARAIARGTRTDTGMPGAQYWQQRASYKIDARYDPASGRLTGSETIAYTNNSPDTLQRVYLHLRP